MSNHPWISVCILLTFCKWTIPQLSYTHISLPFKQGQVDSWTVASSGCSCPHNPSDYSCACCVKGGCNCDVSNKDRCVQCGLETSCGSVCNVTLHSENILSSSGRSTGELKSSPDMRGPSLCWFRFVPGWDERVEIHLYRVLRIGEYDAQNQRCVGGGLMLKNMDAVNPSMADMLVCGHNERYSPPLVLFQDSGPGDNMHPVLIVKMEELTERSQFLAHFSFTKKSNRLTGQKIEGGEQVPNSECEWEFQDCSKTCTIASPGFPGIFPQNGKCIYNIGSANYTNIRVSFKFLKLSLPRSARSCDSNFLAIYKGDQEIHRLCGGEDKLEYSVLSHNKQISLHFRSGSVIPPYIHNGFLVEVKTSSSPGESSSPPYQPLKEDSEGKPTQFPGPQYKHLNNAEPHPTQPSTFKTQTLSRNQQHGHNADKGQQETYFNDGMLEASNLETGVRVPEFGCNSEVQGDRERAGRVSSSSKLFKQNHCSLVFRGAERDVLLIKFTNIVLSGSSCSSSVKISVQDPNSKTGVRVIQKICQTLNVSQSFPVVINSSLVFLDFKTNNNGKDNFQAFFKFHNVLQEGRPRPNTTCDIVINGDTFPFLPKLQGFLDTPNELDLFWKLKKSVDCEYSLETGANKSTLLTVSATSPSKSSVHCLTGCDGRGCQCITRGEMSEVDHILILSAQNQELACFCGHFQKLLPQVFRSREMLRVKYYHSFKNNSYYSFEDRAKFSAQYKFMKSSPVQCGHTYSSKNKGRFVSQLLTSETEPLHEDCEYVIEPPPHRLLHLHLNIQQNQHTKIGCSDWEVFIWTEPRAISNHSGNSETPATKGAKKNSENVGRMCGGEVGRSFTVLDSFSKIIHIRMSVLSKNKPGYTIAWNSEFPLPAQIKQDRQGSVILPDIQPKRIASSANTLKPPIIGFVLLAVSIFLTGIQWTHKL